MTLEEIKQIDLTDKNVLIIGFPASGKTFLSSELRNGHKVLHTDWFKDLTDFEQKEMFEAVCKPHVKYMIEGVAGYWHLGQSLNPDIVIECERPRSKRDATYLAERPDKNLRHLVNFNKKLTALLNEYYRITPKDKLPQFITFNNDY